MTKPVFPELRNIADSASTTAQRIFIALNVAQLGFFAVASLIAGVSPTTEFYRHRCGWEVVAFMSLALLCTTALRIGRFEVRWFKCRAFAENAKSLAWRYVMVQGTNCGGERDSYLNEWRRLKERLPELQKEFALASESRELITDWMQQSAERTLPERVALYRKFRVEDQIAWYARNARSNRHQQNSWFWALFLLEAATIAYAAYQAMALNKVSLVGFVAAVGSGIVAWLQIKRYSDLGTSYAIAADDIALIAEKFNSIADQQTLNEFVDDIEEAISREHSMWLARRDC